MRSWKFRRIKVNKKTDQNRVLGVPETPQRENSFELYSLAQESWLVSNYNPNLFEHASSSVCKLRIISFLQISSAILVIDSISSITSFVLAFHELISVSTDSAVLIKDWYCLSASSALMVASFT